MTEFQAFFSVGFHHIVAWEGIDHILFVVALCAVYDVSRFRKLLVLITAFTLGHSLTLALASVGGLDFNPKTIEFVIPITIFLTAFYNFFEKKENNPDHIKSPNYFVWGRYLMAFFFGTIHGLAFSNFLRMAFQHSQESILLKLLAFNIGLEVGQILVILLLLGVKYGYDFIFLNKNLVKNAKKDVIWQYLLSAVVLVWSLKLLYNQIFG